jgi:nicotinate-nucleotide adenylyltransferase
MNIGLYFGSFNPIHTAHLLIASYVAESNLVDKVWFIVSPQNPLKPSTSLLNEYDRLHLVNKAIENDSRFKAVDIEFRLPKPSYTIDTLVYLKEKYPKHNFYIIIGADSFENLPKWKNYNILVSDYHFIVYKRTGTNIKLPLPVNFHLLDAPLLELSSSEIRSRIKAKKSILYMLPEIVIQEIERNGYYK